MTYQINEPSRSSIIRQTPRRQYITNKYHLTENNYTTTERRQKMT